MKAERGLGDEAEWKGSRGNGVKEETLIRVMLEERRRAPVPGLCTEPLFVSPEADFAIASSWS